MQNLTIKTAHKGLMKKEFSAIELTRFYLDKIKKENKTLNTFLTLTEKLALEQAKKVDKKINQYEKIGLLEGIPIAIKDNILVEGHKNTAGSKILENYIAPYDATVIEKLKKAGAIILGKTNLDEFAMGSSTENSAFRPVKNPLDITRVPGGSSGGSAAAVAANQSIAALGSDTGGSIRQPASFCGVVGFKPSYGMVSRYGLSALASSLDQIGTIAKNVKDAKLIFEAIQGQDKMDSTAVGLYHQSITGRQKSRKLRVGIPKEYFEEGISKEVKEGIGETIKRFERMGSKIKEVSLPLTKFALPVYYIILPAEASANLARYDGIKYGYSTSSSKIQTSNLINNYLKTRARGFGDEVIRRIILGTYVLSAGYREAYYNKAQKIRALIKKEFEKIFSSSNSGVDILLTPTTPTSAFKIGEKRDPLSMYLSDVYTVPASLAGLPAISIPCSPVLPTKNNDKKKKIDKMPIGLQIISSQFQDEFLLEIAESYERLIS